MSTRKGLILAGGTGSRLWPIARGLSKQLMPVNDKPMIYYPLSVLMPPGIREIGVVTTPQDQAQFQNLLGDGSQWGVQITWLVQPSPDSLAQAYLIAEEFLDGGSSALVLGMDPDGRVNQIIEKPDVPPSNYAVTGLYFLDGGAAERAHKIKPSPRGELEIVTLLESYLTEGTLCVETIGRGFAWLDTRIHRSLLDAANFVRTLQSRQGMQTGCPEDIAYGAGWIDDGALTALTDRYAKTEYGAYLLGQMGN